MAREKHLHMAQGLVIGVSIFGEHEEHESCVSKTHGLLDIKKYPTDDILTGMYIQSAVLIVEFRQIGKRVLSRAEGREMVAMC